LFKKTSASKSAEKSSQKHQQMIFKNPASISINQQIAMLGKRVKSSHPASAWWSSLGAHQVKRHLRKEFPGGS
jgi:hypothetical protein